MSTTTVRLSEETRKKLKDMSKETGQPMQAILDQAVEKYRRERFLDEANAAFERLQKDEKTWGEELEERRAWNATLQDDLD